MVFIRESTAVSTKPLLDNQKFHMYSNPYNTDLVLFCLFPRFFTSSLVLLFCSGLTLNIVVYNVCTACPGNSGLLFQGFVVVF